MLLSRAEYVVPTLQADGSSRDAFDYSSNTIERLRPRIEEFFEQIERRTSFSDGGTECRAFIRENV